MNKRKIMSREEKLEHEKVLLDNIFSKLEEAKQLLEEVNGEWKGEDGVYRFYHNSFKVFYVNETTTKIVDFLKELCPLEFNPMFKEIIDDGLSRSFGPETNSNWSAETRPCLEAFFHARCMLEMVVKYGEKFQNQGLTDPPQSLPTGWGLVLHLFKLR